MLKTTSSPLPIKFESDSSAPSPPAPIGFASPLKSASLRADLREAVTMVLPLTDDFLAMFAEIHRLRNKKSSAAENCALVPLRPFKIILAAFDIIY